MIQFVRVAAACLVLGLAALAAGQTNSASPLGKWKGESLCTVKPSACHDETVVYEITAPASNRKDVLVWKADKIVNGEQQNMGSLVCTYAAGKNTFSCDIPNRGKWEFQVNGDAMSGTLKLADGTLFRKVSVKRM